MSLGTKTKDELNSLTVVKLKDILRKLKLKLGGKKSELVDRIYDIWLEKPTESKNFDDYTRDELLNLAENMYGVRLDPTIKKEDIIVWIQKQKEPDVIGPGPQIGALSPIVTSPTSLPVVSLETTSGPEKISLPPILPSTYKTSSITVLPPVLPPVITSPVESSIQLPPISPITILQPTQMLPFFKPEVKIILQPTQMLPFFKPEVKIPSLQETIIPEIKTPPLPPIDIRAPISPTPTASVTFPTVGGITVTSPIPTVTGLTEIPGELPDISLPQVGLSADQSKVKTDILMPLMPTVTHSKSIKIPAKIGTGGLSMKTDLSTLSVIRGGVTTSIPVNPSAAFQQKRVSTGTKLPSITTIPLPTKSPTGITTQPIHIPKIKSTMPTPVSIPASISTSVPAPVSPRIALPSLVTVMKPISLTSPVAVTTPNFTSGLAVAYTPQQQVVENIKKIDPKKLNPSRARRGDNSYSVPELRAIAGSINLPKSGNKKDLVNRIIAAMKKVNTTAID